MRFHPKVLGLWHKVRHKFRRLFRPPRQASAILVFPGLRFLLLFMA